jgi:hypothetical protein
MADLKLINSKSTEEEILEEVEEIGLPEFEILESEEDETWFQEMIDEFNEMVRKDKENESNMH